MRSDLWVLLHKWKIEGHNVADMNFLIQNIYRLILFIDCVGFFYVL